MADVTDCLAAPRPLMRNHGIDGDVDIRPRRVLGAQPSLELRALNLLHRTNALRDTSRLVRLQEHRDPVVLVEDGPKECQRRGTVNAHGYVPVLVSTT